VRLVEKGWISRALSEILNILIIAVVVSMEIRKLCLELLM
jgi:hypothetical protein